MTSSSTRRALSVVGLVSLISALMSIWLAPPAAAGHDGISVTSPSLNEGNTGTRTFTFTISCASPCPPKTISYSTRNGTATAGEDYTATSSSIPVALTSVTPVTVEVPVTGDTAAEPDETFFLDVTSSDHVVTGQATIFNDDGTPPVLSVNDPTAAEGDAGTVDLTFTVSLSAAQSVPVTADYVVAGQTATPDADYEPKSGTITIAPSTLTQTVTVKVRGEDASEIDETLRLELSNPRNATIGAPGYGTGTITNDDTELFVVSTGNLDGFTQYADEYSENCSTYVGEAPLRQAFVAGPGTPPAGGGSLRMEMLSNPNDLQVARTSTYDWVPLADVTELSYATYLETAGKQPPFMRLSVDLDGDATPDEFLFFFPANNTDTEDRGVTAETWQVWDVRGGLVNIGGDSGPGGAISIDDYLAQTGYDDARLAPTSAGGAIAIMHGCGGDNATNSVAFVDDLIVGVTPATDAGATTEFDFEPRGSLQFTSSTFTVQEPATGTQDATISVTRVGGRGGAVSVTASTSNGTATAGSDYAATTAPLTWADGEMGTKTFTVPVNADATPESAETVTLTLSDPTNDASLGSPSTATLTIYEDAVSFGATSSTAGEAAGTTSVVVNRSAGTTTTTKVRITSSGGTATAGSDYTAVNELVTFGPGETTKNVTVTIANDAVDENDETIVLSLAVEEGASVAGAPSSTTVTVTDDDAAPTLAINDVTVAEGDSGTVGATFTVTKSGATAKTVTVNFATSNGTAAAGSDYTAASGSLTFAAGETSKTITIAVRGDVVDEVNETFTVTLSGVTNATIADGTGSGTITDDDAAAQAEPEQRYVLAGADGRVYAFNATHRGDMAGKTLNQPVIGLTMTPSGNGYWLVAKDGGIFTFGDAEFFGSMGDKKLNQPVLGMEATPTGKGYWLFAADGGIFTFGDAAFHGSTGDMRLNAPVIGMETTGDGTGYWLVAQDGGIFTFNAPFHGSTGDMKLNQPVFDMAALDDGSGYWLVAKDGGIFTFNVPFKGSAVGQTTTTVIGMRDTPSGDGYWIADASGKVMVFGDARYLGDSRTTTMTAPIVGFAAVES